MLSRICSQKIKYNVTHLKNKLRIVSIPLPNCGIFHLQLTTTVGIDGETSPNLIECAHSLEHMLAAFTSEKNKNAKKLSKEMDLRGISSNAETTDESVSYWLTGLSTYQLWMIDTLCDSYLYPYFDKTIFKQEMNSIKQELRSMISETWYKLDDKVKTTLFKDLPRGLSETKRLENVKNISIKLLNDLMEKWYQPQLVTVYMIGDFKQTLLSKLSKFLEKKTEGSFIRPTFNMYFKTVTLPLGTVIKVPMKTQDKNAAIRIIFPVHLTIFDFKKLATLHAIDCVLSEGFSSKLYSILRSNMGLVYFINFELHIDPVYRRFSHVQISTECEKKNIQKVLKTIQKILQDFSKTSIPDWELRKWKDNVKTESLEEKLDLSPSKYIDFYGDYLLWSNKSPSMEDINKLSLSITKQDIKNLSQEIFKKNNSIIFYST